MVLKISNRDARWLWLEAQGLSRTPTGTLDLMALIRRLGFVQLDTLRVVARAHHHILWSRNQNYREPMLGRLLAEERAVFEHFTHDASVLPMEFYPFWRRQFHRLEASIASRDWFRNMSDAKARAAMKSRIAREGPLSTSAFDTDTGGKRKMWTRPPHKLALDYMWYAGDLSTSHRRNFTKFYDLTERIIPAHLRSQTISDAEQIDWLCTGALDRLIFGNAGDIKRFWGAMSLTETRSWLDENHARTIPVSVQSADGSWVDSFAHPQVETRLERLAAPTSRLRILNPFDPTVRDRARLFRLFGFEYKIEIFVPEAKRRWGYYVYPILESDKFIGRIDLKADRKAGKLFAKNLWTEPGRAWGARRAGKLDAELTRLARFIGVPEIEWQTAPPAGARLSE